MAESLKQKTVKGTIWSALENFSVQGVQFVVMLVMARLLTPAEFGIIGMIAIFIAVSNSFIDSGFLPALIRKSDRTEIDNSTVFYFNIVIGILLYIILFVCAPFISQFYQEPLLTPVTRVIGLSLILGSFSLVPRAQFAFKLDFKSQAKVSLSSAILSGIIGICLALSNFGVWALVFQQLTSLIITTILLWFFSRWKPIFSFSWKSLKELFGFGSKLLISSLIDTVYSNIYSLVIGKFYKASTLGYYTRAQAFSQPVSTNITGIIRRVSFPVLCTIQNEDERLRNGYRQILRISSFIIFPLLIGLASVAKPIVVSLVGEKWLFSAHLLIPICFASMWFPIHVINLNLLQVKGRSDLFLRLEIIKKILGVIILCITIPMGIYPMCWGSVISSILCLIINTHYTGKLLNLGFITQMKDLFPTLLLSFTMGTAVWLTLAALPFPEHALLAIGVVEGAVIYLLGAKLLRFPEFSEIRSLLRRNKKKELVSE